MDVFRHDYVTDELESFSFSDVINGLDKGIASANRPQKWKAAVATERDEVKMSEAVDALQTFGHGVETEDPPVAESAPDGAPGKTPLPSSGAMVSRGGVQNGRQENRKTHLSQRTRQMGHPTRRRAKPRMICKRFDDATSCFTLLGLAESSRISSE